MGKEQEKNSKENSNIGGMELGGMGLLVSGITIFSITLWFWVIVDNSSKCDGEYSVTFSENVFPGKSSSSRTKIVDVNENTCSIFTKYKRNLCQEIKRCKSSIFSWRRMPVFWLLVSYFFIYIGAMIKYQFGEVEIIAGSLLGLIATPIVFWWFNLTSFIVMTFILYFIGIVALIFYIINEKKISKRRDKEREESKPIIKSKYIAVIHKSDEKRSEVISELAKTFDRHRASITGYLSHQKLYLSPAYYGKNKSKNKERKERQRKKANKILARYIVGEYKTVEEKSNNVRENKVKQIAKDLDRPADYIIKILEKKKCNNVPIVH